MTAVTIHEAKTHLSKLIREALEGGTVTIKQGRSGEELVRLIPARSVTKRLQPGWLRDDSSGSDPLAYGFWDPIPDVELALWEGEYDSPGGHAPVA